MLNLRLRINKIFPPDSPVVFLHAHPDDESFLSAGLINELTSSGRRCFVFFGAAAIVKRRKETFVRQDEARSACRILGNPEVYFLKFSEPKYENNGGDPLICQKVEHVGNEIFSIISKCDINERIIVVSYDRNGGYGNIDHKMIYLVGRYIKKKFKRFIRCFLEVTINRDMISRWLKIAEPRPRKELVPKTSYWAKNFGTPHRNISYYYKLTRKQIWLKRKALSSHKSQICSSEFPLSLSKDDFKNLFGREFLIQPSE